MIVRAGWIHKHARWLLLLPAVAAFLAYLPQLGYGFVWDDLIFLVGSNLYRDPSHLREALTSPFLLSSDYFRPLALLTFMAEMRLGGLNPFLPHLSNLLLHTVNTALVTALAFLFLRDRAEKPIRSPLIAGLLYALHPALVEGVAFISSRFDLLSTTLLLLALLADITLEKRGVARALAVGMLFFMAALVKEMAVCLVFVLPLWHLARASERFSLFSRTWWRHVRNTGHLWTYAAMLGFGILYLGLRYSVLGYLVIADPKGLVKTGDLIQHVLLVGRSFGTYILLMVWPFTTLAPIHYAELPIPVGLSSSLITLAALLALLWGLAAWYRRSRVSGSLAAAGALSLLPVVNIVPLYLGGSAFAAERYLLFPWALFSIAVVVGAVEIAGSKHVAPILIGRRIISILWLIACLVCLEITLPRWKDQIALWTWGMERAPESAIPYINLASELFKNNDLDKGIKYGRKAVIVPPHNSCSASG